MVRFFERHDLHILWRDLQSFCLYQPPESKPSITKDTAFGPGRMTEVFDAPIPFFLPGRDAGFTRRLLHSLVLLAGFLWLCGFGGRRQLPAELSRCQHRRSLQELLTTRAP
ncbi:hypothetical protein EMIT0373P_11215 [Pseudomonas chlororaphis]